MTMNEELKLVLKGGGNFVHLAPVFSINKEYIFIAYRELIYCYTVKTGKRFLKFKGLTKPVIGFDVFVQDNVECLCACSENGEVIIWKADNAIKLKSENVNWNVMFFKIFQYEEKAEAIIVRFIQKSLQIQWLNLTTMKLSEIPCEVKCKKNSLIDIGGKNNEMYLACVNNTRLFVATLDNGHIILKTRVSQGREFTCVKFHPEENCFLTGDATGRVVLWNGLKEKKLVQAVYHWHTLPVQTLCFSVNGTTFYSGGGECVLVKWNVENPLKKKFLPRMHSELKQIAVSLDDAFVAVGTGDNAIKIMNPFFNEISTVQHLFMGDSFPAGIKYDTRSRGIVLNGIPGHLQFYLPSNMQLMYNLDIACVNKLTSERDKHIENIEIAIVALSQNSTWMATVEERKDSNPLYYESRLKFWKFNTEKQTYQLNTSIEFPHEGKTSSIQFQPSGKELGLQCITIGEDNLFKIWVLVDTTSVYKKGSSWRCTGAAFYRDLTPGALAFSYDGSLVAISFEHILTVWLPETCKNKSSLVHPLIKYKIDHVAFGSGSNCHLLVSASRNHLNVWSLLTVSMIWAVELDIMHLVSDHMFEHMAVITTHNDLYVFYPSSSAPIYEKRKLCDRDTVLSAVFIPKLSILDNSREWHQKSDLMIINTKRELFCLTAREETDETIQFLHDDKNLTLFGRTLPALKSTAIDMLKPVSHSYTKSTKNNYINEYLNNPIQTMLPIRFMCSAILRSMVYEKRKIHEEDVAVGDKQENGVEEEKYKNEDVYVDKLDDVSNEQISWISSVF